MLNGNIPRATDLLAVTASGSGNDRVALGSSAIFAIRVVSDAENVYFTQGDSTVNCDLSSNAEGRVYGGEGWHAFAVAKGSTHVAFDAGSSTDIEVMLGD